MVRKSGASSATMLMSDTARGVDATAAGIEQQRRHHRGIERRLAPLTTIAAGDLAQIDPIPDQAHHKAGQIILTNEVLRRRRSSMTSKRSSTRPSLIPPSSASASVPTHTPACLADGGSGHADTTNSCPKWAAAESDLRDHAVRLSNRRGRHRLRRCCDGEGKSSNSNQPDHASPPLRVDRRLRVAFRVCPLALALARNGRMPSTMEKTAGGRITKG
jgi:hypothetical protein